MTSERPEPDDAPLASPGARWTREEDEELVAAVLAGTDLVVIAERHGRTRVGIEYRLLKMIPAGEDIPADQRLGWIMAKLTDPGFDWRAQLARPGVGETPRPRPLPRRRLSELIRGDDRMADEGLILAVAELSFPRAHLRFVTGLIAGIAGVHARHQSSKPDTNGSR